MELIKQITNPLNIIVTCLVAVIFVLIYFIGQAEEKRQIAVDHVLDNCEVSDMVTIVDRFVKPIYDCSKFGREQ